MRSSRWDIVFHFLSARYRWATLRGAKLAAYQEQRVHKLLRYVQAHSPFYRTLWQGCELANWRALPIVDKRQMMAHFTTFNTHGVTAEAAMQVALRAEETRDFNPVLSGEPPLTVGLSSGTSGHRGLFLVSPAEQAAWAGVILARTLHHLSWRATRVAFFLRANSNLYQQTQSALVQFRYFDLLQPLATSISALNLFQPEVLVGPPQLLGLLATAIQARQLVIHPTRLISVAEVLEPQVAQQLETVFQTRVEQIYQCTEGLLAVTCAAGNLHLQEDLVAVQLEPLPVTSTTTEQLYTPIITDLWRTTQPIIRYRLNDVIALSSTRCACGSDFRVLARIEGRCDDICYFPDRTTAQLRPFFPDALRRMVLLAHPQIEDYLVVQPTPGSLRIHLQVAASTHFADVTHAVQQQIEVAVKKAECRLDRIEFVVALPSLPAGAKRRRVQAEKFNLVED